MLVRFFNRLNYAIKAFTSSSVGEIVLSDGIVLHLATNRIIIRGDLELHAQGNLRLSADKHVIIQSGKDEEERPGYVHGIWMNSREDAYGRPLLEQKNVEVIEDGINKYSK